MQAEEAKRHSKVKCWTPDQPDILHSPYRALVHVEREIRQCSLILHSGNVMNDVPGESENATFENRRAGVNSDTFSRFSCYDIVQ